MTSTRKRKDLENPKTAEWFTKALSVMRSKGQRSRSPGQYSLYYRYECDL